MTVDFSGYLKKGVAPHNVNHTEWTAMGMRDTDWGRTWSPFVPETMPGVWTRCLWGPNQLHQMRHVPEGAEMILLNEPNLSYEPLRESAELSPEQAAAIFVVARWWRPDIVWWGPAVNGIDAWGVNAQGQNVDGLPYPWFRAFIKAVFEQWLPVKERFGLPGPFENLAGFVVNWYSHSVDIPAEWKMPGWAADRLVEAAQMAGLQRERPVRIGEFSCRQQPAVLQSWLEDMKANRWIQAAHIFTPFDERKPHFSLLRADMTRKATGEVWAHFEGD